MTALLQPNMQSVNNICKDYLEVVSSRAIKCTALEMQLPCLDLPLCPCTFKYCTGASLRHAPCSYGIT